MRLERIHAGPRVRVASNLCPPVVSLLTVLDDAREPFRGRHLLHDFGDDWLLQESFGLSWTEHVHAFLGLLLRVQELLLMS